MIVKTLRFLACSIFIIQTQSYALPSYSQYELNLKQRNGENILKDYGNTPIWPLPANAQPVGNAYLDPNNFTIIANPSTSTFLNTIIQRYIPLIMYLPNATVPISSINTPTLSPILSQIFVNVANTSDIYPQQETDESYTITFASDLTSITITANTNFGARHALESFSQMVNGDRISNILSVGCLNIQESPRFPYRGLLIDTARHWLPPNFLLSIFDAMGYNKMNALQIGFGIDWSWTVESLAYPNLTDVSYGPPGTHIYNQSMIKFLVNEAALRGVRIIPYLEVLSHDALGYAVPDLMWCNSVMGKGGLPHPLHNETWEFYDALFADYKNIFPEHWMNVGLDEFDSSCWTNDTEINAWNAAHGYTGVTNITALYMTNLIASMKKAGFYPIFFAEAFGAINASGTDLTGLNVIFDAWDMNTPASAVDIIQAPGAKVIISSYCFLAPTNSCPDNLPGGGTPNWWTNMACEIQNRSLFPPEAWPFLDNIVGGHSSRWGEQTDATNLWTVTWPAVMGVAEKLWSPVNLTNGSYYGTRQEVFATHRCVHIRRGSPVQPTSAYSWSCDFEWEPVYPPLTPLNPNVNHSSWIIYNNDIDDSQNSNAVTNTDKIIIASLQEELRIANQRIEELETIIENLSTPN